MAGGWGEFAMEGGRAVGEKTSATVTARRNDQKFRCPRPRWAEIMRAKRPEGDRGLVVTLPTMAFSGGQAN